LVPGVEVYAYATHVAVARWGRAWLDRGTLRIAFRKPVYDGCFAEVVGTPDDDALTIRVTSDGIDCAHGEATISKATSPTTYVIPTRVPPARGEREPASAETLAVGTLLTSAPVLIDADRSRRYLADVRETHTVYCDAGLIHPGLILRQCNAVLVDTVVLPAWVHIVSSVTNVAAGHVGQTLQARARVLREGEERGHRVVELDVQVFADEIVLLAHVEHTAIWRLRGM
jgi:hypothetical protein